MIRNMVERVKTSIEVPVWVLMLLVPILITIFVSLLTITMSQSNTIVRIQEQTMGNTRNIEINKLNIEGLNRSKVNIEAFNRLEITVDRIELKLDTYINTKL
jgi:uncharacterized membrane protein